MATGNPYVPVSISGYNVTPPTDDGAQTDNNTVEWDKHKTKLGDPIKTGVESTQTAITDALDKRLLNNIAAKTGAYTVLSTDRGRVLDFTGGAPATFTLLAAATAKLGFELIIRNSGTAVLTVDGDASETIDGLATIDLFPGQKAWLQCDGTNWADTLDSLRPGVLSKTNADSPYTVLVDDNGRVIDVDASGGAVTINLPAAATAKNGFSITIKKTDSSTNAVTIDGDGTENIDGELTLVLDDQYRSAVLVCDSSEWFVSANKAIATAFEVVGPTATTSGTTVDITVSTGAKAVHIALDGISADNTASILTLQLGDSGGIETTGYEGIHTGGGTVFELTTTLSTVSFTAAGLVTLRLADSINNNWIMAANVSSRIGGTVNERTSSGRKSLSGELTTLRLGISPVGNFDAGQATVQIET